MDFHPVLPLPGAQMSNSANPFANHDFMKSFKKSSRSSILAGVGKTCEIRRYDSLYDSYGYRQSVASGKSTELGQNSTVSKTSALVATKFWTREREYDHSELEIRSPHMKAAMKAAIPSYKDFNVDMNHIVLRNEPACIFHFRRELEAYGNTLRDETESRHVFFLLQHMYEELSSEIGIYNLLVENVSPPTAPLIDFDNLWMVFRPGDVCYVNKVEPGTLYGWLFRFRTMDRCRCTLHTCLHPEWKIEGDVIDYNGDEFGFRSVSSIVYKFDGFKEIFDLPVMPFHFHPMQEHIRFLALARGMKFRELHGRHPQVYDGISKMLAEKRSRNMLGPTDKFAPQLLHVRGRVVIDSQMFYQVRPSHQPDLKFTKKIWKTSEGEQYNMSEDDLLVCSDEIAGYALLEKKWGHFKVDLLEDIDYDLGAIDQLVMSEKAKHQVFSLVQSHEEESGGFDDIIKGKGRGMIFLFHGEPGVGKTLMAESVADRCRRPLIRIDASTLGIQADSVERGLRHVFTLAERWQAVVLIDEADVFLEARRLSEISRNSLVAVFLRLLEYYQGILILTTNRIDSFDPAFKSRIHVAIHFPRLTLEAREQVWRTFLLKVPGVEAHNVLQDAPALRRVAAQDLNGRQIKNVVRAAYAMARSERAPMNFCHIDMALESMREFEINFEMGRAEAFGKGPGGSRKRRRTTDVEETIAGEEQPSEPEGEPEDESEVDIGEET